MARITVEDCLKMIPNRFVLANIAAKRTKQLLTGAKRTMEGIDNKSAVTALREIASGSVRVATEEEVAALKANQASEEDSQDVASIASESLQSPKFEGSENGSDSGEEDKTKQAAGE